MGLSSMKCFSCLAVLLAINFNQCLSRSIPQPESPTPHSQPPSPSPVPHSPPPAQHSLQPPGSHQPPQPPPGHHQPPPPSGYQQPPSLNYYHQQNPGYPPRRYHPSPYGGGLDPTYLLLLNGGLTGGGFLNNPLGHFSPHDNPLGTLLLLNQLGGLSGGFAPYQPNTAPWGCSPQFGAVNCPNLYPGHHPSPPAYPQHPQTPVYQQSSHPGYQPPPHPVYQPPPPPPAYQPPPPGYHQLQESNLRINKMVN